MERKSQEICLLYNIGKNHWFCPVFFNIPTPMILLDSRYNVRNINEAAREIMRGQKICGSECKGDACKEEIRSWMADEIENSPSNAGEIEFKKVIETQRGKRHFSFIIKPIYLWNEDGYIVTLDDHTEKDIAQKFMNHSFQISKTMSKISQRFVGVYDIDEELGLSLKDIGEITSADRVYIFQFFDDMKIMSNTHEWCAEDVIPQVEKRQGIPTNRFPWWMDRIANGKSIHIEDINELPLEAAAEKDSLESQQIKSLLALPLRVNEKIIGYLGIDHIHENEKWGSYDLLLLKLAVDVFKNVFERQITEMKLKKSEQLFRELLQSANDAIFIHKVGEDNKNRKFVMVNDNVCKMLGYTREELLLMGPLDITVYESSIEEILSTVAVKGKHKFEVTLCAKNGEKIPVEINAHVYMNQKEKMVMSIARDMRERKKVEEELRKSEKKYRKLVETAPDAILIHNGEERITFANRQAMYLFGAKSIDDLIGKNIRDFMSPKYQKEALNRMHCVERYNVNIEQVEEELITLDGRTIVVEISATMLEQSPNPIIQTVIRDITARKKIEKEVRLFHQAVEQSSSGVIVIDLEGKIQYINSEFAKHTGYILDEIIGENPVIFKSEKQSLEIYENMVNIIRTGREWHGELLNKRKNGELFWALVSISPIKDHEGNIINYLAIQEDITERKIMEEELKYKNAELRKTIETLEATQMHLIQQEQMAGIGQLAAGVAHEINNPLGFIISNFNTLRKYIERYREISMAYRRLKDSCQNHEAREKFKTNLQIITQLEEKYKIHFMDEDMGDLLIESIEGLDRISKIVKGLRIFSKVDQHNGFEEFDLNFAIENTLLLAANEIKYYTEIKKNLGNIPLLYGNSGQINQVLLNLIVNASYAIRASRKDTKGLITINTYRKTDFVYCEIIDNGIGIPKDIINQIFNPFFTTKPIGEGTGLGLSISYDIIKNKHNGEITVESTEGIGTKFLLRFPCWIYRVNT